MNQGVFIYIFAGNVYLNRTPTAKVQNYAMASPVSVFFFKNSFKDILKQKKTSDFHGNVTFDPVKMSQQK